MFRFAMRFYKKGYMRFISHLDLQRLFLRALKRADIRIAYSQGYNPHPKMNIVQPLALGFESESEYFEFDTDYRYDPRELVWAMDLSMPEGLKFYDCKEFPAVKTNLSSICREAVYEAIFPLDVSFSLNMDVKGFLEQSEVLILKRDKKTKQMVPKDVKPWVNFIEPVGYEDGKMKLSISVRCATNETVNPARLLQSLAEYCGFPFAEEDARITRIDCYVNNMPLFDAEY